MTRDRSTELAALRGHLQRALCWVPALLVMPLACTSTGESAKVSTSAEREAEREGGATTTTSPVAVVDEPTTAVPPEPEIPVELMHMPSCPTGTWCGTEAIAKTLQLTEPISPGAKVPQPVFEFEGCAGAIYGKPVSEAEAKLYGDIPQFHSTSAVLDVELSKAERLTGLPDACCYEWMEQCPGGRPLLDGGEPQLARLRTGASWTAALPRLDRAPIARLSVHDRQALAQAWLADARLEHSSIASFARAQRELAAVGAPASLIFGCAQAELDERRHARIGFGLAAAYGGPAVEPEDFDALPVRAGGLARVAIDTFIEGCIGETVAAACIRRAASEADDPTLARLLERIADDEGDHAALAWQTLAWALERGGLPIASVLVAIADRLRPTADSEPDPSSALLVRGHGRLDPASQARVRRDAWTTIIDPLLRDLTRA